MINLPELNEYENMTLDQLEEMRRQYQVLHQSYVEQQDIYNISIIGNHLRVINTWRDIRIAENTIRSRNENVLELLSTNTIDKTTAAELTVLVHKHGLRFSRVSGWMIEYKGHHVLVNDIDDDPHTSYSIDERHPEFVKELEELNAAYVSD